MSETVSLSALVRDRRLQCREGMNDDTIDEYAEAMKRGVPFPEVTAVRHKEQLLLVDGWHRARAAERAGFDTIEAEIIDGSWSLAVELAAAANAGHGLRRSNTDKRRAVLLLLEQPNLCQLGGRALGDKARVSHTFVNQIRREFGLKTGEVLTAQRRSEIEGEPPAEWQALYKHRSYYKSDVLKLRFVGLQQLGGKLKWGHLHDTIRLRLGELAVGAWPWPEDTDEAARKRRAATADTVEDLERVILAEDCPVDRLLLLQTLHDARAPHKIDGYLLDEAKERFKGRPALAKILDKRIEERRRERASMPSKLQERFQKGEDIELCQDARRGVFDFLTHAALRSDPAELSALRELADRLRPQCPGIEDCTLPGCPGYTIIRFSDFRSRCWCCNRSEEEVEEALRQHLSKTLQACAEMAPDLFWRWADEGPAAALIAIEALVPRPEEPKAAAAVEAPDEVPAPDPAPEASADGMAA